MSNDGTPPRHLHPVEPPFDADYDTPRHDRRPATDIDAERAVLGALLLDPNQAPQLALELHATDFYRPEHEQIWNHAYTLLEQGTPLDPITLAGRIQLNGTSKLVDATYVVDLLQACPNPANATYYATQVRDAARLRAIATTATKLQQLADRKNLDKLDITLGDAVQALDDAALRFGPRSADRASGLKDLSWILGGLPPTQPPPAFVKRTDGHALFYAGKVNGIFGDPECGKTWIAQAAIVEALNNGGTAAMIDVDHNGQDHTAARLLLLGASIEHLADPARFRYYEPEDELELRAAVDDIVNHKPDVVVLDSIGEMLPMLGVNSNDGDEVTGALRLFATRPATAGSCVITIDHLPKGHDARSTGMAIGTIAKKRMIRGAYIRAETKTQPAPGSIGRTTLRIEKDTVGELRRSSGGGYAGTFTLDSTQEHVSTWEISRDHSPITPDGRFRPTHLMEQISRYVEDNDQCTVRDIRAHVKGKTTAVSAAIECLLDEGFLAAIPGPRNATLHHSNTTYREADDDTP